MGDLFGCCFTCLNRNEREENKFEYKNNDYQSRESGALNIIRKEGPWSKKRTMKLNSKKLMSINQFKSHEYQEDIENKKELPRIYDVDHTMRLQKAERKN